MYQSIPDRRTFDRRLNTISIDALQRIAFMGKLFVTKKLVNPHTLAADSTLIKANRGRVWHKSAIKQNKVGVPARPGIDKDARLGYSANKGRVFGYKLHLIASTGSSIVPLAADYTQANVYNNQRYKEMVSVIEGIEYVAADCGYDDCKLYNYSNTHRIHLICPIKRYKHTPDYRLNLMHFYQSRVGQSIYRWRSISVEPLIEQIKSVFRIDPLPVRGY